MIIVVPRYEVIAGKLVFLAGPIQGADDWQAKAIGFMSRMDASINIATPRGNYANLDFDYDRQVDWESHHLALAAERGAILFWLAREKIHYCNRSYAQTTRFELAEWATKHVHNKKIRIFIGIEGGFTNARYIRRRLSQDCPEITIHDSLEALCEEVVTALR